MELPPDLFQTTHDGRLSRQDLINRIAMNVMQIPNVDVRAATLNDLVALRYQVPEIFYTYLTLDDMRAILGGE